MGVSQRDSAFLLDMLVAARDASSFTKGMSYDGFAQDRKTQLAVISSVEIAGGAAAHVSKDTKQAHSAIPWREMVDLRDHIVRDYFRIDLQHVWDTVCDDLPTLLARFESLVPSELGEHPSLPSTG